MRTRLVPIVSITALLAAFAIDLLTPQLFVAAILLDAPIVLSSLGGSRRFTFGLVAASLAANAVAGYVNGVQDHYHWDSIGIGDRILSALSIVFVGYLSTAVQESARRAGRLAAQESRTRREARIAASVERVRASLSLDLVLNAIARETTVLFDAVEARFISAEAPPVTRIAREDGDAVELDETRPGPDVASLVQRALDGGEPLAVERRDAFGRHVCEALQAPAVLAFAITDRDRRFGTVVALGRSEQSFTDAVGMARAFAELTASALAQARLFAQLAERNDALEERSAVIRDLVYAISHDLRTPLAALGMTLRQAQAGAYGELPPAYREIVGSSITATDDVQRLAETLLLVARFESADRAPERQPIDLPALVEQIASELTAMAHTRGVTLAIEAPAAATVIGDRRDLRRAIVNLVGNALEHTPAGGRVAITVAPQDGRIAVIVEDDGFGVPENARPQLFIRFAGGEARHGGGSGLGLYIVRRIAEESGGSVAYAPREQRGSRFTIVLPAARPPA